MLLEFNNQDSAEVGFKKQRLVRNVTCWLVEQRKTKKKETVRNASDVDENDAKSWE